VIWLTGCGWFAADPPAEEFPVVLDDALLGDLDRLGEGRVLRTRLGPGAVWAVDRGGRLVDEGEHEAAERALANEAARVGPLGGDPLSDGAVALRVDGDAAATLVLTEHWEELDSRVPGDLYVVVGARDAVFYGPEGALDGLRELGDVAYTTEVGGIGPLCWMWTPGGWMGCP
jgi:hypothetical protein